MAILVDKYFRFMTYHFVLGIGWYRVSRGHNCLMWVTFGCSLAARLCLGENPILIHSSSRHPFDIGGRRVLFSESSRVRRYGAPQPLMCCIVLRATTVLNPYSRAGEPLVFAKLPSQVPPHYLRYELYSVVIGFPIHRT